MTPFSEIRAYVYVLENPKAQRVKVGMTSNNVADRLINVNRMWRATKGTCQICGSKRLVNNDGLMPIHEISGRKCKGANSLPIEKDLSLAEEYLAQLKINHSKYFGAKKGSSARIIKSQENRIEQFRNYTLPAGRWHASVIYNTDKAGKVEETSHKILADYFDAQAPFGEVFCCSVAQAMEAIQAAMTQLGVSGTATKEIREGATSEKYGQCIICGNNLTETGACTECIMRFSIST